MSAPEIKDTSKLCIHTITTKPWSIEVAAEKFEKAGVKGITVWRQALEGKSIPEVKKIISDHGLETVSLCRGGFYPAETEEGRQKAIQENIEVIEEAAELGSPLVVLVCGAVPGMPLTEARKQIRDGISATLDVAKKLDVKLGIEPLHPMYAGDRSAVNNMAQANALCEEINSEMVGIAADVYHLWWDDQLEKEIKIAGEKNRLFAFHICDWKTPTLDFLNDRGLMGEGCIDIKQIRGWVEEAGFDGFNEVEIFSDIYWKMDQDEYLEKIIQAYLKHS